MGVVLTFLGEGSSLAGFLGSPWGEESRFGLRQLSGGGLPKLAEEGLRSQLSPQLVYESEHSSQCKRFTHNILKFPGFSIEFDIVVILSHLSFVYVGLFLNNLHVLDL